MTSRPSLSSTGEVGEGEETKGACLSAPDSRPDGSSPLAVSPPAGASIPSRGPRALYNEIDSYAAEWIGNLSAAGHIAPGDIDTRSVVDLRPADVAGYAQFHTFAGIAGWSLALRLAGVPDDFPVWTGSCPCQPFSAAGRRGGFADERHLWPAWFELIDACRPALIFGEQVASKDGLGWLDAVFADLEGAGYACRAADLCAAGVGAPHIRQRLWFVAYANGGHACAERQQSGRQHGQQPQDGSAGRRALAYAESRGCARARAVREPAGRHGASHSVADDLMGDAERIGLRGAGRRSDDGASRGVPHSDRQRERLRADAWAAGGPGPWSDLIWIPCRDGKARPTRPGLQPLAHGVPARVGKLRAAGNVIVPQVAAAFITAVLDSLPTSSVHGRDA